MNEQQLAQEHEKMRNAYWTGKDLDATVGIASAAISAGIAAAEEASGQTRTAILSWVKTFTYDLASYTWPGWDEAGIEPSAEQVATGLDAARANLALARNLGLDADTLSLAHWMLGAQLMANGSLPEARAEFAASSTQAQHAGDVGADLLARGFGEVATILEGGDRKQLDEILGALSAVPDGKFYIEQIETALRVFTNG